MPKPLDIVAVITPLGCPIVRNECEANAAVGFGDQLGQRMMQPDMRMTVACIIDQGRAWPCAATWARKPSSPPSTACKCTRPIKAPTGSERILKPLES